MKLALLLLSRSESILIQAAINFRQVIVEKMLDYLRGTSDEVQKADVVKRISELAERFAPDTQWFIEIMNQACCPLLACSQSDSSEKFCGLNAM